MMPSNIRSKTQDLIGYWTRLDSDIILLELLHDQRVSSDRIAVTDTFRLEKDGIEEVPVNFVANFEGLAAME